MIYRSFFLFLLSAHPGKQKHCSSQGLSSPGFSSGFSSPLTKNINAPYIHTSSAAITPTTIEPEASAMAYPQQSNTKRPAAALEGKNSSNGYGVSNMHQSRFWEKFQARNISEFLNNLFDRFCLFSNLWGLTDLAFSTAPRKQLHRFRGFKPEGGGNKK